MEIPCSFKNTIKVIVSIFYNRPNHTASLSNFSFQVVYFLFMAKFFDLRSSCFLCNGFASPPCQFLVSMEMMICCDRKRKCQLLLVYSLDSASSVYQKAKFSQSRLQSRDIMVDHRVFCQAITTTERIPIMVNYLLNDQ